MATLGVDGLASGLDTTSIITKLMDVERQPQTLLKKQLDSTQAKATAYRAVNTRFDAVRTAAEALSTTSLAAGKTATSSSAGVTATATAATKNGSTVTFDVTQLATTQQVIGTRTFPSATASVTGDGVQPSWPIQVVDADGHVTDTIVVPSGSSLADVADLISSSGYGLDATVVQVGSGEYRLKVSAKEPGSDGAFRIGLTAADGTADETAFTTLTQAQDAVVDLGNGVLARSSSNSFTGLVPGTTVTVSKAEAGVTVSFGNDTSAITTKVKALVDAANGALGLIKGYTVSTAGATTATLQGDRTLVQLADSVLDTISTAIGGASLSSIGLQLNKDGTIAFDSTTFASRVAANPALLTTLVSGTPATTTNGVTTPAVPGLATKLAALAKTASDSSTGSLVQLATGRDTLATAMQDKIDAWDLRLTTRQETLTKQFTAMESALSTLKNQSTWLTSQIAQLYNPNASS